MHDVVAARLIVLIRPTLALTSISLLPVMLGEHRPIEPLALPPTLENPLGAKTNVLLPAARFALALTVMSECSVVSRNTAFPLAINAIQRLPRAAEQVLPFVLGQTETVVRLLTAATRAACIVATSSLAEDASLLPRIRLMKLGAAMPEMIASTASVTINSTSETPAGTRLGFPRPTITEPHVACTHISPVKPRYVSLVPGRSPR